MYQSIFERVVLRSRAPPPGPETAAPSHTMPVFSKFYSTGFVVGIAAGGAISMWMATRESIYLRVKSDLQKSKH